ncbi:MAG: sigma-70 family RNA polymerase sigma factor [Planctomycetes bacterium]|nr:sigma-70 family RNA polymerase sigma factor [Planctomycetota bacterium]
MNNKDFYQNLVSEYSDEIYRYAYRQCGNEALAEDLVSETYTEAWKSLDNLRKRESARAWLFQIFRHRFYRWLDRDKKRPDRYSSNEALDVVIGGELDEEYAMRESLQSALDLLEVRFREPFLMVFLQGHSCKEVAEQLDIPLGTVLSRIYRARQHLKLSLKDFAHIGLAKADSVKGSTQKKTNVGGDL